MLSEVAAGKSQTEAAREYQVTPYDNAKAERFMRTLKYEEVYLNDYETFAEVLGSVEHVIEAVYNHKRLHSVIGYLPPAEFEAALQPITLA